MARIYNLNWGNLLVSFPFSTFFKDIDATEGFVKLVHVSYSQSAQGRCLQRMLSKFVRNYEQQGSLVSFDF